MQKLSAKPSKGNCKVERTHARYIHHTAVRGSPRRPPVLLQGWTQKHAAQHPPRWKQIKEHPAL